MSSRPWPACLDDLGFVLRPRVVKPVEAIGMEKLSAPLLPVRAGFQPHTPLTAVIMRRKAHRPNVASHAVCIRSPFLTRETEYHRSKRHGILGSSVGIWPTRYCLSIHGWNCDETCDLVVKLARPHFPQILILNLTTSHNPKITSYAQASAWALPRASSRQCTLYTTKARLRFSPAPSS